MPTSDKLATHDNADITLVCFAQVTDEWPVRIGAIFKVAVGYLIDFACGHTSSVNGNEKIGLCTMRIAPHKVTVHDTNPSKRMKRTDQLAGALREQALVDFGMETGTYAGAAFSKGAVFNESGQGRPLPRVRYEAATAALKCTVYHSSSEDREGYIGKSATTIEDVATFFSTD